MPTIEVDDDTYAFLKECQELLKTQDNRATANVIFFNEYPDKKYADFGDEYHTDGHVWCNSDMSESWDSDEDLVDFIIDDVTEEVFGLLCKYMDMDNGKYDSELGDKYEYPKFNDEQMKELNNWILSKIKEDDYESSLNNIMYSFLSNIDVYDEIFEDDWSTIKPEVDNFEKISYSKEMKICESGLFSFFEKDIKLHKEMDGHNYHEGQHSYGGSIQRSPYMLKLREWLMNQKF